MKGLKSLQRLDPFSGQLLILDTTHGLLFTCLLEINILFKYLEKSSILQHYEQLSRKWSNLVHILKLEKSQTLKISFTLFEVSYQEISNV